MTFVGSEAEKKRVACYALGKLGHSVLCPYEGGDPRSDRLHFPV